MSNRLIDGWTGLAGLTGGLTGRINWLKLRRVEFSPTLLKERFSSGGSVARWSRRSSYRGSALLFYGVKKEWTCGKKKMLLKKNPLGI